MHVIFRLIFRPENFLTGRVTSFTLLQIIAAIHRVVRDSWSLRPRSTRANMFRGLLNIADICIPGRSHSTRETCDLLKTCPLRNQGLHNVNGYATIAFTRC
jgi:hypothetical protein